MCITLCFFPLIPWERAGSLYSDQTKDLYRQREIRSKGRIIRHYDLFHTLFITKIVVNCFGRFMEEEFGL